MTSSLPNNTTPHLVLELKSRIRKLDHDMCDLRFLNNQYAHKVRCLEKDSKAKAECILQLQEKNLQAVVQTPGNSETWGRPLFFVFFFSCFFCTYILNEGLVICFYQVAKSVASPSDVRECRPMSSSLHLRHLGIPWPNLTIHT